MPDFFKKINWKIVLGVGLGAGLVFFLAKDFLFRKPVVEPLYEEPAPISASVKKPALKSAAVPSPLALKGEAKIAVVLDDWGNNYSVLKLAKDLKRPVTLAILPNLPHSRRIAEEAYQNKMGVMLHMPMQATNPNQPAEPQTITTELPERDVLRYLNEAVDSIPHVQGVNNHQGSAATSDTRIMRIVLKRLKERGLFFVDSHVIATSVASRIARETGIPFAKRHVFIDNVATVPAVKQELLKAKDLALKKGEIVVIGHDKKATLQALLETAPEIERSGVRFVLVRDLVKVQKA